MLLLHLPRMYGLTVSRLHALLRLILRACPLRRPLSYFLLLALLRLHDGALDALRDRVLLHHLVLLAVLLVVARASTLSHLKLLLLELGLEGTLLFKEDLNHVGQFVDLLVFEVIWRFFYGRS